MSLCRKWETNSSLTREITQTLVGYDPSLFSCELRARNVHSDYFLFVTDQLTVSETATETPQDEGTSINSPRNLSMEAMYINHNFSQQVLKMVSPVSISKKYKK